jgi:protein-tyrosine phosphatase
MPGNLAKKHLGKLFLLHGALLHAACNPKELEVETACLQDTVGNYLIKWETSPKIKGLMQLQVSDDPDAERFATVSYTDISVGVTTYIPRDHFVRKYFRLVFNNSYRKEVASRLIPMDSVPYIRDLGGHPAGDGQEVRWGKVFRSGDLSRASEWDSLRLGNLGIKTVIDMRMDGDAAAYPVAYPGAQVVSIPVVTAADYILRQILSGKSRKGDVSLYMQDMYLQFTENTRPFAQALALFTDAANYPILILDPQGKDCAGFLSALLLAALDVPEKAILRDYMEANDAMNPKRFARLMGRMGNDAEEAMTVLLTVNEAFLDLAFKKIKKENGTLPRYIGEELFVTAKQKEKLREILLSK